MSVFLLSPRSLLLAVALVAATARPVSAQQVVVSGSARTQTAEERARRRSETARALAEAVERARARLDEVRVAERDPEAARAIREVDAALRAAYSDHSRAYDELVRAQELASSHSSLVFDDALFKRSLKEATELQLALMRDGSRLVVRQRGFMGYSYASSRTSIIRNGEEIMTHSEYPKLLSVEPGSPAEAAGLRAGDYILAYDGHDLKQGVPVSRVLVPNKVVKVRISRDGRTQEVPVRVGARLEREITYSGGCGGPACAAQREPRAPLPARPIEITQVPVERAPTPPRPSEQLLVNPTLFTGTMIAGAEFRRVESDMRDQLDVSSGAVVLRVARGSPAQKSGLRFLDVVTRADGKRVSSGTDLYRALETATERNRSFVVLEIVREKRKQEVKLSW